MSMNQSNQFPKMPPKKISVSTALVSVLFCAFAYAQQPPAAAPARPAPPQPIPDGPVAKSFVENAMQIAGNDYIKTTAQLQCGAGATPANFSNTVLIPPTKIFDNLYYVGLTSVGAYAIMTSEGIILIDTLNNSKDAEDTIEGGLKKLGLDPSKIKYIVITHAHGDHYGGAVYLKEKYGSRILMGAADWDFLVAPQPNLPPPFPGAAPRPVAPKPVRDMVATDGQKLTLGDTTITLVDTHGHTPGTISVIFPVKDKGTPHMAALWGGTGMPGTVEQSQQYLASVGHFAQVANANNVDVEVSNHGFVDDSLSRMEMMRNAKPGDANPFVVGQALVSRYMNVIGECAKARIARIQKQ